MKIVFYATLRPIVGGRSIEMAVADGATACDLLHTLSDTYPPLAPMMWAADGSLTEYLKVYINGRDIRHLQSLETPVPEGATVDIFPPVAGG